MTGSTDRRDETTWVVLELTHAGEQQVETGALEGLLREGLSLPDDHPVFIPTLIYKRGEKVIAVHLMEGYAFVASGLPEATFFELERNSPYVKRVLSKRTEGSYIPALAVLPHTDIEKMQQRLRDTLSADLTEGMRVQVIQGPFTNMTGEIVHVEDNNAAVLFVMRSFKIIRSVPKVFLGIAQED